MSSTSDSNFVMNSFPPPITVNVFVVKNISAKKKKICWAPLWSPIFPHTLSQLPCLLPAVLSDKSNQKKKVQKPFCMMYKWKCLFTAVYLDTVKFILHIDHDLCFKYHWTFNHFFYWLASEYLNIHFSSHVAVWVLSECSVNSDRFVFLPELG